MQDDFYNQYIQHSKQHTHTKGESQRFFFSLIVFIAGNEAFCCKNSNGIKGKTNNKLLQFHLLTLIPSCSNNAPYRTVITTTVKRMNPAKSSFLYFFIRMMMLCCNYRLITLPLPFCVVSTRGLPQ